MLLDQKHSTKSFDASKNEFGFWTSDGDILNQLNPINIFLVLRTTYLK